MCILFDLGKMFNARVENWSTYPSYFVIRSNIMIDWTVFSIADCNIDCRRFASPNFSIAYCLLCEIHMQC